MFIKVLNFFGIKTYLQGLKEGYSIGYEMRRYDQKEDDRIASAHKTGNEWPEPRNNDEPVWTYDRYVKWKLKKNMGEL